MSRSFFDPRGKNKVLYMCPFNFLLLYIMSQAVQDFLKKENTPMSQKTYWIVYIATALTFMLKTIEASAFKSYELIQILPSLGQYSGLVNTFFL
jgi:uncharacterized membrane protein YcaP (DUF421 family)